MKTCPNCHRPVADDARTCPHPGCGKPISGAHPSKAPAIRPPPPPRKIQLAPANVTHAAAGAAPSSAPKKSRAAGLLLLLLLFTLTGLLGGTIVYLVKSDARSGKPEAVADVQGASPEKQAADGKAPAGKKSSAAGPPSEKKDGADQASPEASGEGKPKQPENMTDKEQSRLAAAKSEEKEPGVKRTPAEPEVLGLYSQRTAAKREDWIGQYGGTPVSETAVAAGLDWLARHQADDGHWGPDCLGKGPGSKCEQDHPCSGSGGRYEAALTGLAVLAYQAGGHYYFNQHQYSDRVARGLHCLADQQGFNGELVGSLNNVSEGPDDKKTRFNRCYIYEHAIATFALAEACALAKAWRHDPDPALWKAAVKGVKFLESQQHEDGGWRYDNNKSSPSDSSVSGWAMLALKTAREAEIEIDSQTIPRLVEFFDRQEEPLTGRTHYQTPRFGTDALTGVGMMVDEFIHQKTDTRRIQLAAPYLADEAVHGWGPDAKRPSADYYLWYNCTLAMFQAGGEPWKRWNDATRERVITLQVHGSECVRGSWPPNDRWSGEGGRIYSTALAVLTLEVYYRFAKEHAIADKPAK